MKVINTILKRWRSYWTTYARPALLVADFALITLGLSYCSFVIPELSDITSLLLGFAPLILLAALHIILVVFYIYFIGRAEEAFEEENEKFSRESARRKIWRAIYNDATPFNVSYISLKEHSPPAFIHLQLLISKQ